jgi:osmoprotectant transport system ATP-binding protein
VTPDTARAEGPSAHRQAATLELRHISKRYPGTDEPAIADLSLEVPAGEICVLVGPSGCGKTTAMRLVNRMIEPTSGDILVDGVSIIDRKPSELRREIGYAIQQIGLFPHQTIAENIATVPKLLGWDKRRIAARVEELLDLIGLEAGMARRYPGQLSGGQRQRVGVARALAADPPLMLMDEPFGAIDPINRERLQNEFLRLQGEIRKTVVFVTHDIDEAIKMGDRIAILRKGGILAQYATPAELLMAPADAFVEDFVGADRALTRLALQRVRDIDLWDAPTVRAGDPVAQARARVAAGPIGHALLVDDDGRPLAWLGEADLTGDTVQPHEGRVTTVELDDVLRDALADLLQGQVMYGVVTDHGGRVAGILSVEVISGFLTQQAEGRIDEAPAPAERPA